MNQDIVQKQIRQRVFNQSTLSTIGNRVMSLRLPMLVNEKRIREVSREVKKLTKSRRECLRKLREQFIN